MRRAGGADLGAHAAAFTGSGVGFQVHGEALPGHALGGLFEDLEVMLDLFRDGPVGNGAIQRRIGAGGRTDAAGDAFLGIVHRQRGADVAHIPKATGSRGHHRQEAIPGNLFAVQDRLDHLAVEGLLIIFDEVYGLEGPQFVLLGEGDPQAGGAGFPAEIFGFGSNINRFSGMGRQSRGDEALAAAAGGALFGAELEEGQVGFYHFLTLAPFAAELLIQDFFEALLEFFFPQDAQFLVDEAQNRGPGEVPV